MAQPQSENSYGLDPNLDGGGNTGPPSRGRPVSQYNAFNPDPNRPGTVYASPGASGGARGRKDVVSLIPGFRKIQKTRNAWTADQLARAEATPGYIPRPFPGEDGYRQAGIQLYNMGFLDRNFHVRDAGSFGNYKNSSDPTKRALYEAWHGPSTGGGGNFKDGYDPNDPEAVARAKSEGEAYALEHMRNKNKKEREDRRGNRGGGGDPAPDDPTNPSDPAPDDPIEQPDESTDPPPPVYDGGVSNEIDPRTGKLYGTPPNDNGDTGQLPDGRVWHEKMGRYVTRAEWQRYTANNPLDASTDFPGSNPTAGNGMGTASNGEQYALQAQVQQGTARPVYNPSGGNNYGPYNPATGKPWDPMDPIVQGNNMLEPNRPPNRFDNNLEPYRPGDGLHNGTISRPNYQYDKYLEPTSYESYADYQARMANEARSGNYSKPGQYPGPDPSLDPFTGQPWAGENAGRAGEYKDWLAKNAAQAQRNSTAGYNPYVPEQVRNDQQRAAQLEQQKRIGTGPYNGKPGKVKGDKWDNNGRPIPIFDGGGGINYGDVAEGNYLKPGDQHLPVQPSPDHANVNLYDNAQPFQQLQAGAKGQGSIAKPNGGFSTNTGSAVQNFTSQINSQRQGFSGNRKLKYPGGN